MKGSTLIAMILTLGFVWGGFALLLAKALRSEKEKEREARGGGSSGL